MGSKLSSVLYCIRLELRTALLQRTFLGTLCVAVWCSVSLRALSHTHVSVILSARRESPPPPPSLIPSFVNSLRVPECVLVRLLSPVLEAIDRVRARACDPRCPKALGNVMYGYGPEIERLRRNPFLHSYDLAYLTNSLLLAMLTCQGRDYDGTSISFASGFLKSETFGDFIWVVKLALPWIIGPETLQLVHQIITDEQEELRAAIKSARADGIFPTQTKLRLDYWHAVSLQMRAPEHLGGLRDQVLVDALRTIFYAWATQHESASESAMVFADAEHFVADNQPPADADHACFFISKLQSKKEFLAHHEFRDSLHFGELASGNEIRHGSIKGRKNMPGVNARMQPHETLQFLEGFDARAQARKYMRLKRILNTVPSTRAVERLLRGMPFTSINKRDLVKILQHAPAAFHDMRSTLLRSKQCAVVFKRTYWLVTSTSAFRAVSIARQLRRSRCVWLVWKAVMWIMQCSCKKYQM